MATKTTIARFEGIEEVIGNLTAYERRIQNKYRKEGLLDAAEIVRADAARRAPVLTGRLQGGMLATWSGRRRSGSGWGRAVALVGPSRDAFYGEFQEFGTSKMAAQPFMRPALDANGARVRDAIGDAVSKATDAIRTKRGF